MLILIHRSTKEELVQTMNYYMGELTDRFGPDAVQDGNRNRITINNFVLYKPIVIQGRFGDIRKTVGINPDFYYTDRADNWYFVEHGAQKVNGIRLTELRYVLKIVDILKRDDLLNMAKKVISDNDLPNTEDTINAGYTDGHWNGIKFMSKFDSEDSNR